MSPLGPRLGLVVALLATAGTARAVPPTTAPYPSHLPRYTLDLTISPREQRAEFRQRVTWTNRADRPTNQLVFNFYPHYHIPDGEYLRLAKTLELLRLNPSDGIDKEGGHGQLTQVTLIDKKNPTDPEPVRLKYHYREDQQTILYVDLPVTVGPGERVTVELVGSVKLPEKQGRWGQWQGVTYMTHALPMVSFYDDKGWKESPFIPWHQPFWNEAGHYEATINLPKDEVLACSAPVRSETDLGDGRRRVVCEPFVGRDFAVTCSARYEEHRSACTLPDGREVTLKCVALPGHEFYAKELLRIVGEAIPIYSKWFGPYPYQQFTVAESFFGWNGNECSGLILIDERVFAMPHLGVGYVEYLASHETCHQWWYNLVGTNGYSETFMDEGAATYFTHRMLDGKLGPNNNLLKWPDEVSWLPNIRRENYRNASWYGAIKRNEAPAAAGDLPDFGHLYGLFSGAYDRGSKVYGMIEHRLGEAAFFEFIRGLVRKYSFDVLTAAQLRQELETFTGQPWGDFFDQWVYGKGHTDWKLETVEINGRTGTNPLELLDVTTFVPTTPKNQQQVEVVVRQKGSLHEPTTVEFQFADGNRDHPPVRIPVGDGQKRFPLPNGTEAEIESGKDGKVVIRASFAQEPTNVVVDPDRVLLDANPADNRWKNPPAVSFTPLYSTLNETDLTTDWDRWNFTVGPWVWGASYQDPWYTRSSMAGVRAGAYRTQTFAGGAYAAFRSDYRDLVVGADGLWDHVPWPHTQLGFNVERRVGGPYFGTQGDPDATRAVLFARQVLHMGSSLYLPPMSYIDFFTTYQDNFLPFQREFTPGAVRPGFQELTGVHYRLNLYTPYWDPERGFWIDAVAGGGVADLGPTVGNFQTKVELAGVLALPERYTYLSRVKAAGRVVVQGAIPDQGQFFALGGGTLFRGYDLAQRQGSFLWVVNKELRVPLFRHVDWDVADHTAGVKNLHVALWGDTGAVYTNGRVVQNVAFALGAGLRADLAVFSFIERATLRVDMGKTVNDATPFQFWFGVQQAF
jgi:hypothetical protein